MFKVELCHFNLHLLNQSSVHSVGIVQTRCLFPAVIYLRPENQKKYYLVSSNKRIATSMAKLVLELDNYKY